METDTEYFLNTKHVDSKQKPIFFAGTSINKITISFYLMPVYEHPDLLDGVSPELLQHRHGKSCFRFKSLNPSLIQELTALTKKCAARIKQEK